MINYNSTMLYQSSSNELMQAQHYQSQISQKEFEIRLMDINNRFTPNSRLDNFYIANLQKQNIKSEIHNLIHNRNRHLYNAIDNALDLAMSEKGENFYPTAYLAVSSINSFLRMLNNSDMNFMLPISVMMKLSHVNFELTHKSPDTLLAKEIAELNKLCSGV